MTVDKSQMNQKNEKGRAKKVILTHTKAEAFATGDRRSDVLSTGLTHALTHTPKNTRTRTRESTHTHTHTHSLKHTHTP